MRFRPLRLTFGPGAEALRGLHCDPEPMQSIPEDAGFTVFGATSNEDGKTRLPGHLPSPGLRGKLRRRISAMADVRIVGGANVRTDSGPTE
ncbi:MAG: hypothetical protein AAGA28_11585 [Pseudomonadota bacterium]